MQIKAKARQMIAEFEGYRAQSYRCPANVLTVGYGHTGPDVREGMTITREHAEALLDSDMAVCDAAVRRVCPTATEHQRWAMVSLAFNIGVNGFAGSTVARLHARGDYAGAARAFTMWNKATVNGRLQELPGLTRRRAAETAFYLTPDVEEPAVEMPQAVAPPKTTSKTVIAGSVSAAAGAVSVIDQMTPILDGVATAGASVQNIARLSALALSIIALGAVVYVLVRYVSKARRGDVVIR
jgi:lysozyme